MFAALENIHEESSPGINGTISDRLYGASSGTRGTVFPTLLRPNNHQLGKLGQGRAIQLERLLADIIDELTDFPPNMLRRDQGP